MVFNHLDELKQMKEEREGKFLHFLATLVLKL